MITIVITTKYFGPTNYRGSRFKVTNTSTGESRTVSYDYSATHPAIAAITEAGVVQGGYAIHHGGSANNGIEYWTAIIE